MRMLLAVFLMPVVAMAIYDVKWYDANSWCCPFYNDGRWGVDMTVGSGVSGGSWPQPLRNFYLFGGGPWVGCISAQQETLVTVGLDINSTGTEMAPTLCRYWRQGYGDSRDRVYRYPGDWPPPRSRFPMAPQTSLSDVDMWSCFCDSDPSYHLPPDRPIGVDICLTAYGFCDSVAHDLFILKYELANRSGLRLDQVYFGIMLDADVGSSLDDGAGLVHNRLFGVGPDTFRVTNTGFSYDWNNTESRSQQWEHGTPGAVALRLLRAHHGLGLTAFKAFALADTTPRTDPARYLTMAGYDFRTGQYQPYDSLDTAAADMRFVMSSGPLSLSSDEVATFWYAVIAASYGTQGQPPQGRDTTDLALSCERAEQVLQRLVAIEEPAHDPVPAQVKVGPCPFGMGRPLRIVSQSPGLIVARIYDVGGSLVRTLRGASPLVWDGTDAAGGRLPKGAYMAHIASAGRNATCKVVMLGR